MERLVSLLVFLFFLSVGNASVRHVLGEQEEK